jgi:hypothetical protein
MRSSTAMRATVVLGIMSGPIASSTAQRPTVHSVSETALREYSGAYQWGPTAFVYLQLWNELSGTNQLVAFDESGDVRTLYPTRHDRFFVGPGAAVSTAVESREPRVHASLCSVPDTPRNGGSDI